MMPSKVEKLFLNKELSAKDLDKGVEFEVDYDGQCSDSEDESFGEEAFETFKDDISNLDNDHKPKILSQTDIPFKVLRERMKPVTEDGKVLKEVLKPGCGIIIPDKSVVMMHYDAYLENQTVPFDSTRLRKRPYKFLFGQGNVVCGLEYGLMTMQKGEISRFLVDYEYAYGTLGCPPRIPPVSDILYEVEVLNFYESNDAIEFEDMAPEDQKKAPFEKIVSVYHCESKMANDLFHSSMYKQAVARYRKSVKMLENISVANEEEDEIRNKYLLKSYLNLAQCYIKLQNPNKAFIYAELSLRLDSENVKAFYRMGLALSQMDEYERAEFYLNKAKQYKPLDKNINYAIAQLECRRKKYLDYQKMFCKRAFSFENEGAEKVRQLAESNEFIEVVEEQIKDFLNSDEKELVFSAGYTENQIDVLKDLGRKHDLAFVSKIMYGNKINKLVKKI